MSPWLLLACVAGTETCPEPESQSLAEPCAAFSATAACPFEVGQHWQSVSEQDCGSGEFACAPLCYWDLEVLEEGRVEWEGSDFNESGTWSCEGGALEAWQGIEIDWSFSSEDCVLTWRGVDYLLVGAD